MLKSLSPLVKNKQIKTFLIRFWPWLLSAIIVLSIFLLLAPYLFRSWVKYPPALRAEIAWRYFCASFEDVCREDCLATRQAYAAIWRPFYKKYPEKIEEKLRLVFAAENTELQAALIKIMAADSDSKLLPSVFAELIADPQASAENKRLIVNFFPLSFQDETWLAQIRHQVRQRELPVAERLYALQLLAPFPDEQNSILVKDLILTAEEGELSLAASKLLSQWPPATVSWSEPELLNLGFLARREQDLARRWRYLWLLSEVGRKLPDKIRPFFVELANDASLDAISRGLAAETLSLVFDTDIKTPDPSARDWQEFYENI